jgi:toxin-antitoxin system PIN domain toxin
MKAWVSPTQLRRLTRLILTSDVSLMAYLRMVTHAAIVAPPLSSRAAQENVEMLARLPNVRLLSEQAGFWDLYRESTRDVVVRGKLVPDAHLAVLLRQHGVRTLYSNDRDFLKFDFLEVRNPFAPPAE